MMKTILLLAFAVFVSSASLKVNDKTILGELIDELNATMTTLPKEHKGKEIFLRELVPEKESCVHDFFCQAEQELKTKVSVLSKYDDFRTDKKLMRNLHMYNNHHEGTTCKPVDEDQDEISLHKFLENLMKCVKKEYSKPKKN
ncbi:interleukin-13 [Megalobrama amblycephala]|uniref:interleukin-13 n=1 Tax=Megalobrama amblycephala TaxID=75352 RepID=UPI0020142E52|nr:interleukin-13 [Megalobrama amblycephala]